MLKIKYKPIIVAKEKKRKGNNYFLHGIHKELVDYNKRLGILMGKLNRLHQALRKGKRNTEKIVRLYTANTYSEYSLISDNFN
jgi:hypothetical protein